MAYENSQAWTRWTEPWKGYVYPADALERPFDAVASTRAGEQGKFAPVLRVARPSWDDGKEFANSLIPSLLRQAKKSIAITQQDIITVIPWASGNWLNSNIWPYDIIDAIAFAKWKNPDLEVRILTSVPWFSPDDSNLSQAVHDVDIYGYHPWYGPKEKVIMKLCDSYCRQTSSESMTLAQCTELFPVHYMYQQLRSVLDGTAKRPDPAQAPSWSDWVHTFFSGQTDAQQKAILDNGWGS